VPPGPSQLWTYSFVAINGRATPPLIPGVHRVQGVQGRSRYRAPPRPWGPFDGPEYLRRSRRPDGATVSR
jgi:hypothetical protein